MRCMACGAEMILVKVIQDVTMPIPGFERRAYMCSLCHDTEQRLVYNKDAKEPNSETACASFNDPEPAHNHPGFFGSLC